MNLDHLEALTDAAAAVIPDGWWDESCVIHAPLPGGGAWHPVDCTPRTLEGWDVGATVAAFVEAVAPQTIKRLIRVARIAIATRDAWAREEIDEAEVVALVQEFDAALGALTGEASL